MKQLIFVLILTILLASCVSLTKTQMESVNQYAILTKNFSAYPSKIMSGVAEVRVIRGVYLANTFSNPKLHIDALDSLYNNKIHSYSVSNKVDISFKIIDKYAQSLAILSSDKFQKEIEDNSQNLGIGLDSLVSEYNRIDAFANLPTNIGGVVGQLVAMGGRQYVRSKQAKEVKKFVAKSDTLIAVMTSNLLIFLESDNIDQLIAAEEWGVHQNYLSFLRQTEKPLIEHEYIYLNLKEKLDNIKTLRSQTISATKQIRLTHKELSSSLNKRRGLREIVDEVQILGKDINKLNKTLTAK